GQLRVGLAEAVTAVPVRLVVGATRVERREPVERARLHAFEDVLLAHTGPSRDLGRGRGAAELLGQRGHGAVELEVGLLHASRHPHRPAAVAEVALQLAEDGRCRERRELEAPFGLEALDGLQEADEGDLAQVVERLPAIRETSREELAQPYVYLDEAVAQL